MRLPSTITLMTQRIRVRKTDRIETESVSGKMEVFYGLFQPDGPSILIAEGIGADRERQTFVHENLHLMLEIGGLADAYDSDEKLVTRLAPILLSWLRENPKAIEYLTDRRLLGKGSATWWENR